MTTGEITGIGITISILHRGEIMATIDPGTTGAMTRIRIMAIQGIKGTTPGESLGQVLLPINIIIGAITKDMITMNLGDTMTTIIRVVETTIEIITSQGHHQERDSTKNHLSKSLRQSIIVMT
jgi:hypothetical protein